MALPAGAARHREHQAHLAGPGSIMACLACLACLIITHKTGCCMLRLLGLAE